MKDTDKLILKAFLVALYQQTSPLPQEIQNKLNTIANSIDTQIDELDIIAEEYLPIGNYYQEAYSWFFSDTAERNKSSKFLPEKPDNDDIDNISIPVSRPLEEMKRGLESIDGELELEQKAIKIMSVKDSVQATKEEFQQ